MKKKQPFKQFVEKVAAVLDIDPSNVQDAGLTVIDSRYTKHYWFYFFLSLDSYAAFTKLAEDWLDFRNTSYFDLDYNQLFQKTQLYESKSRELLNQFMYEYSVLAMKI